MRLAWAEIRRARSRFTSIVAALGLIVVLVLVLAALADGLFFGQTGVARNTRYDLQVQAADAEGSLATSELPRSLAAEIAQVEGVAEVGGVGALQVAGEGPGGELDVGAFGLEPGRPGAPLEVAEGRLPQAGEDGAVAVDTVLRREGVGLGDTLALPGSERPLEVVGVVEDVSSGFTGTAWITLDAWQDLRVAARPEARGGEEVVSVFAVTVAEGADPAEVAQRIDERAGTATFTRAEAVTADPIVATQNGVLRAVIAATFAVAGLVVALFFALLTLEKRGLFAVVKALGAPTRYLAAGLALQALVASLAGLALGGALTWLLSLVIPDAVPTLFRPQAAATVVALTLPTALLGAALSFRRVARIDPASALGGSA